MQTKAPKIITSPLKGTNKVPSTMEQGGSKSNNTDHIQITDCHFLETNQIVSRIDYLTLQFKFKHKTEFELTKQNIHQYLSSIGIKVINSKPDLKYFDFGNLLQANDETKSYCGSIKWRNDYSVIQLEITSNGCCYFNTNENYLFPLIDLSKSIALEIRRLDIAVDSYLSKHGLRYMQQAYSRGLFNPINGKPPAKETIVSKTGKTVIIGSRNSTKQIIGYEKGKQLGYPKGSFEYSQWFRFEVRLRSRTGSGISLEALTNPDGYFVGAYPKANQRLIKSAKPRSIKREVMKKVDRKLSDKLAFLKHIGGKTIYGAVNRGFSSDSIVSMTIRKGKKDNLEYPSFITEDDLEKFPFSK